MTDARPIPIIDLKAQLARIRPEIDEAVARVLSSTAYVQGEDVRLLEREFAAFCGAAHACAVANGTDALHLALRAYGVGPGDEVVTVANTFIATGEAILLVGAKPVFVDVDPATHTMDPARLEAAITPRTKVVLPVHLYGHPADATAIGEVARRHGLPVLEDAAQAHGAEWRGRRAGALGHAACFSFYPTKNLGAFGDAGMVVSSDEGFVARVRQVANHGAGTHRYDNVVLGTNSRLDTLQAAILRREAPPPRAVERGEGGARGGLLEGPRRRARRRHAAREGGGALGLAPLHRPRPGERRPGRPPQVARDRDRHPLPEADPPPGVHGVGGGQPGDLPVSEQLSREVLCLPLYPELPLEDVARVAGEVRAFVGAASRAAAR